MRAGASPNSQPLAAPLPTNSQTGLHARCRTAPTLAPKHGRWERESARASAHVSRACAVALRENERAKSWRWRAVMARNTITPDCRSHEPSPLLPPHCPSLSPPALRQTTKHPTCTSASGVKHSNTQTGDRANLVSPGRYLSPFAVVTRGLLPCGGAPRRRKGKPISR